MASITAPTFNRQPATWQASVLPVLAVIGAPMMLIELIHDGFQQAPPDQFAGLVSLLYIVGWMSGIGGLLRLEATGRGSVGKAILGVQFLALILAAAWALIVIANPAADHSNPIYQVTDVAWPLSHVFMLVVGIAALVARRLPGWQRVTPLACGLFFPASIVVGKVAGDMASGLTFGLGGTAAFLLLSYVARRGWQATERAAG